MSERQTNRNRRSPQVFLVIILIFTVLISVSLCFNLRQIIDNTILQAFFILLSNIAFLNLYVLMVHLNQHNLNGKLRSLLDENEGLKHEIQKATASLRDVSAADGSQGFLGDKVEFKHLKSEIESLNRKLHERIDHTRLPQEAPGYYRQVPSPPVEPAKPSPIGTPTPDDLDRSIDEAVDCFVEICKVPSLPASKALISKIQEAVTIVCPQLTIEMIHRDSRTIDNLYFFKDNEQLQSSTKYLLLAHPQHKPFLLPYPSPASGAFADTAGFESKSGNQSLALTNVRKIYPGALTRCGDDRWKLETEGYIDAS